jgi:hypothetical protein
LHGVGEGRGGVQGDGSALVARITRFDPEHHRVLSELSGGIFQGAAKLLWIGGDAQAPHGLVELLGVFAARAVAGFGEENVEIVRQASDTIFK